MSEEIKRDSRIERAAERMAAVAKDRVTYVSNFHFQQVGEQIKTTTLPFHHYIDNEAEEEQYSKRCKATEEWKPIDCGWVGTPGYVVIESLVGKGVMVHPDPEEVKENELKVLELKTNDSNKPWIIPAGGHFIGWNEDPKSLVIRCQSGECNFRISVTPK